MRTRCLSYLLRVGDVPGGPGALAGLGEWTLRRVPGHSRRHATTLCDKIQYETRGVGGVRAMRLPSLFI